MAPAEPDYQTLSLALQLQLEDLESLVHSNENATAGEETDFIVALNLYKDELVTRQQLLSDKSMGLRMGEEAEEAEPNEAPPVPVQEAPREEAPREEAPREEAPREEAIQDGQQPPLTADDSDDSAGPSDAVLSDPPAPDEHPPSEPDTLPALLCCSENDAVDNHHENYQHGDIVTDAPATKSGKAQDDDGGAGPSTEQQLRDGSQATSRRRTCLICCDNFRSTDLVQCPCSHEYCRGCLENLFRTALTDESLFPPRCCGYPVPVDCGGGFLPQGVVDEFDAKQIEYGTPNRTYCHEPTCSAFIVPTATTGSNVATCAKCQSTTCTICKGAAHEGVECPKDEAAQEMLRVMADEKWQKCYSCGRIVDLMHGCNHIITCMCKAQFCYVCGERWKTCKCIQWDEAQLLARANAVVDRNPQAREVGWQARANMVEGVRRNLQANHMCVHANWRRRSGSHRCEECRHRLPEYIFECVQCSVMACRRCRFNRIQ